MSDELPAGPARPLGVPHGDASLHDIASHLKAIAFWMRFFGILTMIGIGLTVISWLVYIS